MFHSPIHLALLSLCAVLPLLCALPSSTDFLIVGAGTAGCSLAARLCALRPDRTVTLLEKAYPRNSTQEFLVRSPRMMLRSWFTNDLVDSFSSLPTHALNNRTFNLFTGRTLGGSSSINGMQFTVPIAGTIEQWGIHGLDTNSSVELLNRVIEQIGIDVPRGNLRHRYVRTYIEAAKRAGFMETEDALSNSNSRIVGENYLAVSKQGFRQDSCTAYLSPVIDSICKHNLVLIQGVTVPRILLTNRSPRRAVGVEYVRSTDTSLRHRRRMYARREVIVSAGPFNSPKLLQLSGIGPATVLRRAGVKVRVRLPVGCRTQGRAVVPINAHYSGVQVAPSMNASKVFSKRARDMFNQGNGGVLGRAPSFAVGKVASLAYFAANSNTFPVFAGRRVFNAGCVNNERSFGFLRIRNASPFAAPEVQLGMLQNQDDVDGLVMCAREMVRVFEAFPACFGVILRNPPGGLVTEDWVRSTAIWNGHFVGACPVGSVLRGDLTVRKTRALRVVDASVLNQVPLSAGPVSSVYMIAEHMAGVIADSHRC